MEKDNSEAKPSTATPPSDEKKTSGGSEETPAPPPKCGVLPAGKAGGEAPERCESVHLGAEAGLSRTRGRRLALAKNKRGLTCSCLPTIFEEEEQNN